MKNYSNGQSAKPESAKENNFKQELNDSIKNCIKAVKKFGITKNLSGYCTEVYKYYYDRYTKMNENYFDTEIEYILMAFDEWCTRLTRVVYETTQEINAIKVLEKTVNESIKVDNVVLNNIVKNND